MEIMEIVSISILLIVSIIFIYKYFKSKKSKSRWKSPYIIDMGTRTRQPNLKQNKRFNNNIHVPKNSIKIYPYKTKNSILSESEFNFYNLLKLSILDTNYIILPKVRLSDILVVQNISDYQDYYNHISMKHVDFILCDRDTFKPKIAIILDDSSLDLDNKFFLNDDLTLTFQAATLKLLRFNKYYPYKIIDIKENLTITY